jgi:hypothetical protein
MLDKKDTKSFAVFQRKFMKLHDLIIYKKKIHTVAELDGEVESAMKSLALSKYQMKGLSSV